MQAVKTLLNSESLYNPQADSGSNLNIFEEIDSRMSIIGKRYKEIERLQDRMRIYVVSHEVIVDIEENIESNNVLWKIVLSVKDLRSKIMPLWFMVGIACTIKLSTIIVLMCFVGC